MKVTDTSGTPETRADAESLVSQLLEDLASGRLEAEEAAWTAHLGGGKGEGDAPTRLQEIAERPTAARTLDFLRSNEKLWAVELPFL